MALAPVCLIKKCKKSKEYTECELLAKGIFPRDKQQCEMLY